MNSVESQTGKAIEYPDLTVKRAFRAMQCAPFGLNLYATMQRQSVSGSAIASLSGMQHQYVREPITESTAENSILWLIQVGVLRREVDGQGITDSFRLTPLGRQLAEQWQVRGGNWPTPTWSDRLYNAMSRWCFNPF